MIHRITQVVVACCLVAYIGAARVNQAMANNAALSKAQLEKKLDTKMAQMLSKKYPYPIEMPKENEKGVYLNEEMTNGAFYEGWYQNTTRLTKRHHYFFQWRLACAWMKWTPSNQIIAAKKHLTEKNSTMRLGRYGIIGWDQQCFWGLIGVQWIRPLPLWQFKFNEWIIYAEQDMVIGFSGKTEKNKDGKDVGVLQLEDYGANDTWFSLWEIVDGEHKGDFILKCKNDDNLVLDILNDKPVDHAHVIRKKLDYSVSQIWKISAPHGAVQVRDQTGQFCLTRFTKYQRDQSGSSPEYETDVQLSPCVTNADNSKIRNQVWYLGKKKVTTEPGSG